jgi:hypothetical protein
VDTQVPNLIDEMKAKIDTELGKQIACPGCSVPGMPDGWDLSSQSLPTSVSRSA